ncbi:hypothetical protein TREES_T100010535 [Tupaia chinensis]|uniref:Uncharacterized protein n=1 Tax=Tupaia chinensis TaxID=246437 RepID=L9L7R3_TUPCH|nr:hypothetical protein TREES_T100010535 [Tupaia chinensis]
MLTMATHYADDGQSLRLAIVLYSKPGARGTDIEGSQEGQEIERREDSPQSRRHRETIYFVIQARMGLKLTGGAAGNTGSFSDTLQVRVVVRRVWPGETMKRNQKNGVG